MLLSALQDNWFDDTDESVDDSELSPPAGPQQWRVHKGLGADDVHLSMASHGITNAAFMDDTDAHSADRLPLRQYHTSDRSLADNIPDEF